MTEKDISGRGRLWGRKLWGEERFELMETSTTELDPYFRDFVLYALSFFDRPELQPKVRSLCMVAALAALGRQEELRIHIFAALSNGATYDEIMEALVQITLYAGLPKGRTALITARQCFSEYKSGKDKA